MGDCSQIYNLILLLLHLMVAFHCLLFHVLSLTFLNLNVEFRLQNMGELFCVLYIHMKFVNVLDYNYVYFGHG